MNLCVLVVYSSYQIEGDACELFVFCFLSISPQLSTVCWCHFHSMNWFLPVLSSIRIHFVRFFGAFGCISPVLFLPTCFFVCLFIA